MDGHELETLWRELGATLAQWWKLNELADADLVLHRADAVPPDERQAIADALGMPMCADLSAYLSFCNGLRLSWTFPEVAPQYGGSLHIPPLETLVRVQERPSPIDLNVQWPDEYRPDWAKGVNLIPFDFYHRHPGNIEVAFLVPRDGGLDVGVTTDDTASIGQSRLLSLSEYLRYVLRSCGAPAARTALTLGYTNRKAVRAELHRDAPLVHPGSIYDLMVDDPGYLVEYFRG